MFGTHQIIANMEIGGISWPAKINEKFSWESSWQQFLAKWWPNKVAGELAQPWRIHFQNFLFSSVRLHQIAVPVKNEAQNATNDPKTPMGHVTASPIKITHPLKNIMK
jgi:hypothetical protein